MTTAIALVTSVMSDNYHFFSVERPSKAESLGMKCYGLCSIVDYNYSVLALDSQILLIFWLHVCTFYKHLNFPTPQSLVATTLVSIFL